MSLAGLDVAGALLAFVVGHWLRISSGLFFYASTVPLREYLPIYLLSIPVLLLLFRSARLYETAELFAGTWEYVQVVKASTFYVMALVLLGFVVRTPYPSRGWLVTTWLCCVAFIGVGRMGFRRWLRWSRGRGQPIEKAMILGASEDSVRIAQSIEEGGSIKVVGFLDDFAPLGVEIWNGCRVVGRPTACLDACLEHEAHMAILVADAVSWETRQEIMSLGPELNDVHILLSPGIADVQLLSMQGGLKGSASLLRFRPGYMKGFDRILKRAMDVSLAASLLTLFSPVMLFVAGRTLLKEGWPAYDSFDVLGRGGTHFFTFKFRAGLKRPTFYRSFRRRVLSKTEAQNFAWVDRFIFHSGLDKLLQLVNVLRGEMSLVGPRTICPDTERRYGPWLSQILAVKPGMIGNWAFGDFKSLDQEISATIYYLRNWSLWGDLAILLQTVFEMGRTRFRFRIAKNEELNSHYV